MADSASVGVTTWELIVRIAVAGGITALIGLERELTRHPAGIRTHALVGIGAALFTIAGAYGFDHTQQSGDMSRVAAQVVTGIGFLGAGTIIRTSDKVKGLTTAATLWLAAGIGVAAGAGLLLLTVATFGITIIVLLAIRVTSPLMRRAHHHEPQARRIFSRRTPPD